MMGPSVPQGASQDVLALIKTLSDPKATKARIEEMEELQQSINKSTDELRAREIAVKKDLETIEAHKAEIETQAADLAKREFAITAADDDLKKRIGVMEKRANELTAHNNAQQTELKQRTTALDTRENDVARRERDIKVGQAQIDVLRREWTEKVRQLREFIASLQ